MVAMTLQLEVDDSILSRCQLTVCMHGQLRYFYLVVYACIICAVPAVICELRNARVTCFLLVSGVGRLPSDVWLCVVS